MGNTGADKYEITFREIQKFQFGAFCSKWKMTFGKVTPATKLVNEKKSWDKLPWAPGMYFHGFGCFRVRGDPSS